MNTKLIRARRIRIQTRSNHKVMLNSFITEVIWLKIQASFLIIVAVWLNENVRTEKSRDEI